MVKTKKDNKKPKKNSQPFDIKDEMRGLGALVEEVRSDVQGVAEQYGDIKKTLDVHSEMIGSLVMDMAIVKEDLSAVKEDTVSIKNSMKKKVDADEFSTLEKRRPVRSG